MLITRGSDELRRRGMAQVVRRATEVVFVSRIRL